MKEFINEEHYLKYIEKYKGKELLEVYCADWPYDYRYLINANTGEVYNKTETR